MSSPSELAICRHNGSEKARLPLEAACKESEVIARIVDASKDHRLVDEYFTAPGIWEAASSWLRGNTINLEAPGWAMLRFPYHWPSLSRFLRQYHMERLLNEVSNILRSEATSPAPDAKLWTRAYRSGSTDTNDAATLLRWLKSETQRPDGPLETMVKDHIAYHMAKLTPAGRALTTSPSYQDLLKQNHRLCAELSLLQYSNNGAGPEHPSTRPKCHYHTHSNGQNVRVSLPPVVVSQAMYKAIRDVLRGAAKADLKIEAKLCPCQS